MSSRKGAPAPYVPSPESVREQTTTPIPLPVEDGDDTDWYGWYFDTYAAIGELEAYAESEDADERLKEGARNYAQKLRVAAEWTEILIEHCYVQVPAEVREKLRKSFRSEDARKAVNTRHRKTEQERVERKMKIHARWATGVYQSRDECAQEEYETLGYKSFRRARNDLMNTPDPE
ncbi:hypothetical protein [Chromatocurvus halotolerans]|uniref:Uncharacterized protein n=1 Tax=Chromatocurvus halotolerans TaxID=1132028 RepID=A0A4R2KJD6_9GAMM|nr:hypothetical protein [Chromatocurvus halotolerans]TCO73763.1 hypothetical protein EV688_11580 [Chromatocurvus halotolerans]